MTPEGAAYDELVNWLVANVASRLNVMPDTIGIDTPLADCGIDSIAAMGLCADLKYEKGFDVDGTIVWDCATIDAIATQLVDQRAGP
jgi:acyl carrier protein